MIDTTAMKPTEGKGLLLEENLTIHLQGIILAMIVWDTKAEEVTREDEVTTTEDLIHLEQERALAPLEEVGKPIVILSPIRSRDGADTIVETTLLSIPVEVVWGMDLVVVVVVVVWDSPLIRLLVMEALEGSWGWVEPHPLAGPHLIMTSQMPTVPPLLVLLLGTRLTFVQLPLFRDSMCIL